MSVQDISAAGLQVLVRASNTFPNGFTVTALCDDSDPFDTPNITLGDAAPGVNGDMVTWSKAAFIPLTLRVIPGSTDDDNLAILAEANRVSQGKQSALDVCAVTAIYPDGSRVTFDTGKIVSAPAGTSVSSAGRKKTKEYGFTFQNRSGTAS